MDKAEFIEKAPLYYALAVRSFLIYKKKTTTKEQIVDFFSYPHPDYQDDIIYRVDNDRLLDRAIELLVREEIISLEPDVFGPTLIIPAEPFPEGRMVANQDFLALIARYEQMEDPDSTWLYPALVRLKNEKIRLTIVDSDYDDPEKEWQPIPIDRDQTETAAIITAVDDAVEKISADNGYSANQSEERNYVIDSLTMLRDKFKGAKTISLPYIRQFAIDPMKRAARSLKDNATAVVIEVLKIKLREWLMKFNILWPTDWL